MQKTVRLKLLRSLKYLLLTVGFLIELSPLSAQRSPEWLQSNDRGNRYEGTYTRKVSNPSVNLISLMGHLEAYTFGEKQMLTAQFYSPDAQDYYLKVEELRVSQFYWMQNKETKAPKGWNTFENWPVDYFLKRLSISHRNLGILAYWGDKSRRSFMPVLLYHSKTPEQISRYVAQLRLGRSAANGTYKVYQGENRSASKLITQGKISAKSGGTTFPVVVPAAQLEEGWIFVEVNLREQGSLDPFAYSFRFFHKNPN